MQGSPVGEYTCRHRVLAIGRESYLVQDLRRWHDLGMVSGGTSWRVGDRLDDAEALMLECAASGEVCGEAAEALWDDPLDVDAWVSWRTVRAAVLRHLLTESEWLVAPKGVRLRGLRISGHLDLEGVTVRCPFLLEDCFLDDLEPVALSFATIPVLVLNRCRLAGLFGDNFVSAAKLDLQDSVIDGAISLNGARIGGALECRGARLGARADGISLVARGMNVRLSVHLSQGFTTVGSVEVPRANIGGEFICPGAHLGVNERGISLEAAGLRTGGAVFLDREFQAEGAVRLNGAIIGGQLSCDGARIGMDKLGDSLVCDGLRTGGTVSLDMADGQPCTTDGAIRLTGAEITGSLNCANAQLGTDAENNSLLADELKVSVGVLLDRQFTALGAIRLPGANITGQLRCRASRITGTDEDGDSLVCNGIRIGGPAYLDEGFLTAGAVVLSGADIGGLVTLGSARIGQNAKHYSLVADGLRAGRDVLADEIATDGEALLAGAVIGGSLAFRSGRLGAGGQQNSLMAAGLHAGGDLLLDGLLTTGAIVAAGTDIGGRFSCQGSRLGSDANGDSLVGDGARAGGSVYLDEQCATAGAVRFTLAGIGGSLGCSGAQLGANKNHQALVIEQVNIAGDLLLDKGFTAAGGVSLRGASIGSELRWEPGEAPPGEVDLNGARTLQLTDNWTNHRTLGYWPSGRLRLVGFTYQALGGIHPLTVKQRLDWIRSQYESEPEHPQPNHETTAEQAPDRPTQSRRQSWTTPVSTVFATQPYKQLANAYRQAGQEDEARDVEIAMRRDSRKYGHLPWLSKSLNWLLDVTIRYGYQTSRALAGIAALYVLVFLAFWFAQHQGNLIAASNVQNPALHPTALRCVTGYPCFYPAGYAFDLVVPLINIRQADFWQANGHHAFGWAWVFGTWTATALGWFLATLLVVGYSGLARRA